MIPPTPRLGCCNNRPRPSWCWEREEERREEKMTSSTNGFSLQSWEGFLEHLRKEPLDEKVRQLEGEFAAVTSFPHLCPLSLDEQSLCCAMLSLTVPHVSRKCHFLFQNSPTLYFLLSSHLSFPWTDDHSYLLQPWAKLETFFCG